LEEERTKGRRLGGSEKGEREKGGGSPWSLGLLKEYFFWDYCQGVDEARAG